MEKTAMKVFLACALGALIGSIVALQLNQYFWWLGLLVGGLVGYVSYEFKKVMNVIPQTYKIASERRPKKRYWKDVFLFFGFASSGILSLFLLMIILSICSHSTTTNEIFSKGSFGPFLMLLLAICLAMSLSEASSNEDGILVTLNRENAARGILYLHPIPFYLYHLPKGAWWCAKRAPRAAAIIARFVGRFIKTLFLLIHSDIRLLCATYAAIGTAIGYFSGSAIIGAMAGGIFGVINYKVVSQRILRLQPKT